MFSEISDINEINWNSVIKKKKESKPSHNHGNGSEYWNKRAPSFTEHASKTLYPNSFIKIMKPVKSYTLFDMGCGGGTLAIPLASKVKHITAADFSEKMLEKLTEEAGKKNINNITPVKLSWDDDWEKAGICTYDVAIASRSLTIDDIQMAIKKLNNIAKKYVYISTVVGDGPMDRKLFEAVGRKFGQSVDYIYIYNLLYQMGIHANINFITNEKPKIYKNHDDAINSYNWMLQNLTAEEEQKLKEYLNRHLVKHNSRWTFDYKRIIRWAVIWWDKAEQK